MKLMVYGYSMGWLLPSMPERLSVSVALHEQWCCLQIARSSSQVIGLIVEQTPRAAKDADR